jgi:tRNA (guanine-N7-)-methyltransferase
MEALWQCIFGNDHPVEIEVGPGNGTFIAPAASRRSRTNFLGIERSRTRAARLEALFAERGLRNARVINADAACVVAHLVPPASVSAYHVYFPDPWWKRRHQRRRLFTPGFTGAVARTLVPGGRLHVATDVDDLFHLILTRLTSTRGFMQDTGARSPREQLTAFERKGLARGARIREATFVKRRIIAGDYTSSAAPITPAESPS